MSRNDLFLLLACAIVATVLAGNPGPLLRSPSLTVASLISPETSYATAEDMTLFQHSFDHQ